MSFSAERSLGDPPLDNTLVRVGQMDAAFIVVTFLLAGLGLIVLHSASGGDASLLTRHGIRFGVGLFALVLMSQINADTLRMWSFWAYVLGLALLVWVLLAGHFGKGAQRWLDVGLLRFQPAEIMKLAVPMMIAWYFAEKSLPPAKRHLFVAAVLAVTPAVLIGLQPDLGTALIVACAGLAVIFFAGVGWGSIVTIVAMCLAASPALWQFMREYQRQRVLTMLNPESDPLGAGYHTIQSKIALGSGGWYGKGWMNGTQSQLDFIPEQSTDFIFAVFGEEFGFVGVVVMVLLYLFVVLRGLSIATRAQDTYSRLLAAALSMTFFVYVFVNMGMVCGLLPVVGVPLPLVSYGGSSMVTLMAAFGMLMSINSRRRLLSR
ncbi:MAG: rod shape-determining protein RodA [Gammaproteobacteria bacterium]